MNALKNSVTLIGHLGRDPESKTLENGRMFAKFTLATDEVYRNNDGEKVKETQWHNVILWGKKAESMNGLLKKGKEVVVRGKLTYRTYKDKDGIERSFPEIVASELMLTGKAPADS
ncbi:MAG TPA: single-stranded DNA-binding protein [Flavilitoribacter sp.]|nr:single-stranded DNA-binding protein [Lewinella sp.]MCB9278211.1 single-stranded DNA-binding protein [Lewinellaceae bacterium]HMQ61788.1 single-stranded DNA-binding protein [Flavilitoribacter sp.]